MDPQLCDWPGLGPRTASPLATPSTGPVTNLLPAPACFCAGAYKLVVKKDRNYVGFIADGPAAGGEGVDIAIVFRGTITKDEWIQASAACTADPLGGKGVLGRVNRAVRAPQAEGSPPPFAPPPSPHPPSSATHPWRGRSAPARRQMP